MQDIDNSSKLLDLKDFRANATFWVAIAGLVFLAPFTLNNYLQGRYLLGAGSLAIALLTAFNAFLIRNGRYNPRFIFLSVFVPIIIFLYFAVRDYGVMGVLWSYPAIFAIYFIFSEKLAWAGNIILLAVVLPASAFAVDQQMLLRIIATLTSVSLFAAIFIRTISTQQDKLAGLAVTDPLTGVSNRAMLNDTLKSAAQQRLRAGVPMSLLAIDLDFFKAINDTYGHTAGDAVLRAIGSKLKARMRASDNVFRMGGEEFLVLLYNTNKDSARKVAEELRVSIEKAELLPDKPVTVSIGLAELANEEDWQSWLKRSDEKLYEAKSSGRNRVC